MKSELILKIEGNTSGKSFVIEDNSFYNPNITPDCEQLRIYFPGYTNPVYYEVVNGFKLIVNLSNANLYNGNSLPQLPDGLYKIKYSIKPNDKVYVEYYYYHTVGLYTKYVEQVCSFLNNSCELSKSEKEDTLKSLWEIRENIADIKIAAEECGNIEYADNMYDEIVKQIKAISNDCNCF